MKLLLDLGNTRIKWACQAAGTLEFSARGEALYAAQDPAGALAPLRGHPYLGGVGCLW